MKLTDHLNKCFGKGKWIVSDAPAEELRRLGFKHRCTVEKFKEIKRGLDFETRLRELLKGENLAEFIQKSL